MIPEVAGLRDARESAHGSRGWAALFPARRRRHGRATALTNRRHRHAQLAIGFLWSATVSRPAAQPGPVMIIQVGDLRRRARRASTSVCRAAAERSLRSGNAENMLVYGVARHGVIP